MEANQLFNRIEQLRSVLDSTSLPRQEAQDLLEACRELLANMQQDAIQQAENIARADEHEKVRSLSSELEVYLYYCVTLLEFFNEDEVSEATLQAAENSGALDQLARARQLFASSPDLARTAITRFRRMQDMDVPVTPL